MRQNEASLRRNFVIFRHFRIEIEPSASGLCVGKPKPSRVERIVRPKPSAASGFGLHFAPSSGVWVPHPDPPPRDSPPRANSSGSRRAQCHCQCQYPPAVVFTIGTLTWADVHSPLNTSCQCSLAICIPTSGSPPHSAFLQQLMSNDAT